MPPLSLTRIVLYKHGVGYFERQGQVEGDAALALTFKQAEVSDVLKSLTVLDLDGGHVAAVSYDSTKPLEQLLAEVALSIPNENSLVGLLPQLKGARVAVRTEPTAPPVEGALIGVDTVDRETPSGVTRTVRLSLLSDAGEVFSFDLHSLAGLQLLDASLRRDLDFYLRTVLSATKKDARTFTFFARGEGNRTVRVSYVVEAPVWKATYRILLGEEGRPPTVQGWAVVDNTQDEDWEGVELALVAGLPVSFRHDLYTPRFIRRPEVAVKETTGVLPPEVEVGMALAELAHQEQAESLTVPAAPAPVALRSMMLKGIKVSAPGMLSGGLHESAVSSMPAQVRERQVGDLFEYHIEHPVTIRRNQSALVPIVLRPFEGRPVLLYNKAARVENPLRSVEFKNTTGLTLEGGPVTVLEAGSYVGEAMLDTLKPGDDRLVPYAVELSVRVLDNVESANGPVHHVAIRDRRLTETRAHVQKTVYHFDNRGEREQTLFLEHPRSSDWGLIDTPAPQETTQKYWRFRLPLPPKKVTNFTVSQRLVLSQARALAEVDADTLNLWVQGRYFDAKTERALREVVALQHQAAEAERALARLQEEKGDIFTEQNRLRENLQALGDRSSEKDLRERLVRTLGTQEDRLERIAAESRTHAAERDRCRAHINEVLAGLEYEAAV
jgi:hypothetical protein